jgi:hypothetical protein
VDDRLAAVARPARQCTKGLIGARIELWSSESSSSQTGGGTCRSRPWLSQSSHGAVEELEVQGPSRHVEAVAEEFEVQLGMAGPPLRCDCDTLKTPSLKKSLKQHNILVLRI